MLIGRRRCGITAWAADAGRAQERRADGGGDGAGAGVGPASIAAAFRRQRAVVGRAGSGQGARTGAADIERRGPIEAWIIDDTGFPKKGRHSVGVARQYCGQLGKQDNCQVAVTLSIANHSASLPIAYRLYLPLEWTADAARRAQAGVPETIEFLPKPDIALDQIRAARAAGVPPGVVLMDAGYGSDTRLRTEIGALGLTYIAGIQPHATAWPPGVAPLPAKPWSGRGRPPSRTRRDPEHQPVQRQGARARPSAGGVADDHLARGIGGLADLAFCQGTGARRPPRRWPAEPRAEEWLLIEWPQGEAEPTKYWLATFPTDIPFERLVDLAKLRWRIERDYQELKQELGLGHYEGRGWRGFHHHATLCIAAYGFLISERERIPPSAARVPPINARNSAVPDSHRPRGAADPARAPYRQTRSRRCADASSSRSQTLARCPCCNAPRKTADPHPSL